MDKLPFVLVSAAVVAGIALWWFKYPFVRDHLSNRRMARRAALKRWCRKHEQKPWNKKFQQIVDECDLEAGLQAELERWSASEGT